MTPEEIKQRLDEADEKIKDKLRELGFTEAEIQRQLDPGVPEAVKQAEREVVLKRKFQQDLNDPSSGLLDAVIDKMGPEIDKKIAELEAEERARKAAKRKQRVIGGLAAVAVIAAGVWFFVLRDTRSSCEKLVGPVAELEQLTHKQLESRLVYASEYTCTVEVRERGHHDSGAVQIDVEKGDHFDNDRSRDEGYKYVRHEMFATAAGDAILFVAGDQKGPTTEQLAEDVRMRVGHSKDPTGDALAALAPERHDALLHGHGETIKLSFSREVFTPELAKTYTKAVAERAK